MIGSSKQGLGRGILLLVALAALAANLSGLANGFVWDDIHMIVNNQTLRSYDGLVDAFTQQMYHGSERASPSFRPLHVAPYVLQYQWFRLHALPWHALSLLLYVALCPLLAVLLRRSGLSARAATFAALLFAVHPLHAEEVGMLMGQGSLSGAILVGCALLLVLGNQSLARDLLAALLLFASLLCKPTVLFVPIAAAALLLVGAQGQPKRRWQRAARVGVLFAATCGVYLLLRNAVLGQYSPVEGGETISGPARGIVAGPQIALWYAAKLALPLNLCVDYAWKPVANWASPRVIVSITASVAAVAAAVWGLRRGRPWAAWLVWFLAALIPVSQLHELPDAVTDRYAFLPSLGLAALAGIGLDRVYQGGKARARLVIALLTLCCLVFAGISLKHNLDFRDTRTLWTCVRQVNPHSVRAFYNLGIMHLENDELDLAADELLAADKLDPHQPLILVALGDAYFRQGELEQAIAPLSAAVQIDPRAPGALRNLAIVELYLGRPADALQHIDKAHELFPDDPQIAADREQMRLHLANQLKYPANTKKINEICR
ncbi:MAG: tetratricopeptide repeat protein [Candidatus Alcyoniella australis]|nr:tetratricopeptide repeat protein [Candidatus Alcyoniella australis]